MQFLVCPELTTAPVVRALLPSTTVTDGQLCTVINPPQIYLSIGVKLFKQTEPLLSVGVLSQFTLALGFILLVKTLAYSSVCK